MNKKLALIIIAISALLIGAVAGPSLVTYFYPQTASVNSVQLTNYLNGIPWTNGTLIDWGTLNASDTYYFNLTVVNTGTKNLTASLIIVNLPVNWTETWSANTTFLSPTTSAKGNLTLGVPASAFGVYNWTSYITAEES